MRYSSSKFLFIYLWLSWVFIAACRLSLVAASGGCSLVSENVLLIMVAFLVVEHRLQSQGLQQLGLTVSRALAQQLFTGLVALRHVEVSWTRDLPLSPAGSFSTTCISLNHQGSPLVNLMYTIDTIKILEGKEHQVKLRKSE